MAGVQVVARIFNQFDKMFECWDFITPVHSFGAGVSQNGNSKPGG